MTILLSVAYITVWCTIFTLVSLIYEQFGFMSCMMDDSMLSKTLLYMLLVLIMLSFFAPFITLFKGLFKRYKKKVEMLFFYSSLIMLMLFSILTILEKQCEKKYETFSVELWEQHPRQRILMINDLSEKVMGRSDTYILNLIGAPNSENIIKEQNIKRWYYDCTYVDIELTFENDQCVYMSTTY